MADVAFIIDPQIIALGFLSVFFIFLLIHAAALSAFDVIKKFFRKIVRHIAEWKHGSKE